MVKVLVARALHMILNHFGDLCVGRPHANDVEQEVKSRRGACSHSINQPIQIVLVSLGVVYGPLKSRATSHVEREVDHALGAQNLAQLAR